MDVRNHEHPAVGRCEFFSRFGRKYTALYDRSGKLFHLESHADTHGMPSAVIPHDSKTFRRLADGNRGNRFTAT